MAVLSSASLNEKLETLNSIRQTKPEERWRIEAYHRLQDLTDITFNISGSSADIVFVNSVDNLPDPDGARIKLQEGKIYEFTDAVNIGAHYLETSPRNVIVGFSSGVSSLTNDYAGPLISGSEDFYVQGIQFWNQNASGQIIKMDGADSSTPRRSLTFRDVTWFNSRLGEIANYNNVLYFDNAFINVEGSLEYSGEMDATIYDTCILTSASNNDTIVFNYDENMTINNRIRSVFSSYTATSGSTVFNIPVSMSIGDERVQFIGNFFSSSAGAFVSGSDRSSTKGLYQLNIGIRDTAPRVWYYMQNNATATTIPSAGAWVKVAGTTVPEQAEKFTLTTNRATYDSEDVRNFEAHASLSAFGGTGDDLEFSFVKNENILTGSIQSRTAAGAGNNFNLTISALIEMTGSDYVEIWTRNTTDTTSITVSSLNVVMTEIA